jgi:STE24 endopeptidase
MKTLARRAATILIALACAARFAAAGAAEPPNAASSAASAPAAATSAGAVPVAATAAASAPASSEATSSAAAGTPTFRIRPVDDAWRKALPRDADAATQAYLDRLPADVVARSNAYFEGGYWLLLWNFLLGLAISAILLAGRRSARIRDWAARVGRRAFLRDALYGAVFALVGWVLALPLAIYQGYFREHAYGMATQTFGPWFGEQLIGLAVGTVVTALGVGALYAVIRAAGERWALWGALAGTAFVVLSALIGPVWIDPLFNTYKPVEDGAVKSSVLALAHASGVPVDDVYEVDASRQTTRISANVSGIFGAAAIRLNDNLLRRTSLPEIRMVMAHEIGHYAMNHIYKFIIAYALLLIIGFHIVKWGLDRLLARHGARLGLRGVGDVASLPLLVAVFSAFMLVATPITNSMTRIQEIEADRFGLNLSREPYGSAEVDLKLTEYRKPDPGPIEEFVFFDHPSTRFRIHDAMRWREAMGTP